MKNKSQWTAKDLEYKVLKNYKTKARQPMKIKATFAKKWRVVSELLPKERK